MKKTDIKKFDKLWSEKVKERAGYKCEYCGREKYLNSHHIFSRSNMATRFDPDNGISLCSFCHALGTHSFHKAPAETMEWFKKYKGVKFYNRLRKKAKSVVKKQDYKTILEGLK